MQGFQIVVEHNHGFDSFSSKPSWLFALETVSTCTCMWSQRLRFFDALIFRALTGLGDKISDFQVLNVKSGNYANEFAQIQAKFKQVQSHC